MNPCTHNERLLFHSLRGDCTEEVQRALDTHLSACQACREAMNRFRAVFELTGEEEALAEAESERLLSLTRNAMVAADFTPQPFPSPTENRWFRSGMVASLAAFVIFCSLVIGLILRNQSNDLGRMLNHSQQTFASAPELVEIPGGTFLMGDLFKEGETNEQPVHAVHLSSYLLSPYEVTVAEYQRFVEETGYLSSSENEIQKERQTRIIADLKEKAKHPPDAETFQLVDELIVAGGCFAWNPEQGNFQFMLDCNWKKPYCEQTREDPVVCMSWIDSLHYCNWLSRNEGLPEAYHLATGDLLDALGNPTKDLTRVRGYRLPSEAEWEFAAREGGREVRFGNGRNIALSKEINFDAEAMDFHYAEPGRFRNRTLPVGSFEPNRLGLYDMSGNAWEWCHDVFAPYPEAERSNPLSTAGSQRVVRGGRWGGTALEARVFHRNSFHPRNRCNNTGFRLARSL